MCCFVQGSGATTAISWWQVRGQTSAGWELEQRQHPPLWTSDQCLWLTLYRGDYIFSIFLQNIFGRYLQLWNNLANTFLYVRCDS